MTTDTAERAQFHHMKDGTAEDWQIILGEIKDFAAGLPDRIMTHLRLLDGDFGGFPVDRLTHCLQTATLAHKDGRDDEYVVCALLHDIGDTLGTFNHADVAAVLLQPFISEENHWIIKHHGIFQGYYFFHYIGLDRDQHKQFEDHPFYAATREFIDKYDAPAFDPDAETYPLEFFEPIVRRVMAQPRQSLYQAAMAEA
jgi:predicted HD phosphohydrolase